MRVIAGIARGHKLQTIEGLETRPTADRVKLSLFNILAFSLADVHVLDLFAGSGALAIEALSRGAKCAVCVDQSTSAIDIIKKNLAHTKMTHKAVVVCDAYERFIEGYLGEPFDLIFLDPPYGQQLVERVLEQVMTKKCLAQGGQIVVESDHTDVLTILPPFVIVKQKKYGRACLTFIKQEE
ncbi:MAG: 16S rRNA (guanine(966)-N(2))-methyltransferase RsmD [Hyphomonadaceae bacterium]|nr:16S rRNA (guanine(966)-N(2))-methyltransferase RsmD [Clostridia bacterium]